MSLTKEMKARRAKELLEDDVFLEAVAQVKEGLVEQWSQTKPSDTETRENLYYRDRGLDEVLTQLRILIYDWNVQKQRKNKTRT